LVVKGLGYPFGSKSIFNAFLEALLRHVVECLTLQS
jgi:hypothetical protein